MCTILVHHGYKKWLSHCWECWWGWWTISMWRCGPQHFIFRHGKCLLKNYNFVKEWGIVICSYKSLNCILETTPPKFHLLGIFLLWMMIYMWILKIYKCCDVLSIIKESGKYFFVPKCNKIKYNKINGILPWRFMLILLIPNCLLKENHNL